MRVIDTNGFMWFRSSKCFEWEWMPFYEERGRWHERGYFRIRVFWHGFNYYWGQPKQYLPDFPCSIQEFDRVARLPVEEE